jgi:GNAT superfamily N-acetyltransferase
MQIRAARIEDAEEAVIVVRRSIAELCTADHDGNTPIIEAWLGNKTIANMRLWIEASYVLVAVEAGAICGVASMTPSGRITLNYVSPDARFRGVSKSLLAELEGRARDLALRSVDLESTETAHRLYLACGYVDRGAPRARLGSALAYPMTKALGSGSTE